jgi:hypothetical protein
MSASIPQEAPQFGDQVLSEAQSAACAVREAVATLAAELLPAGARGRDWVYRLGLDKSLVSRLLRVLRSESDGELVGHLPAKEGLSLFLQACERAGANGSSAARLEAAIGRLERAMARVPRGRNGLRAALTSPGGTRGGQMEREARRMAVEAYRMLTGMWVRERYSMIAVGASAQPGRLDVGMLTWLRGLHRARADSPAVLMTLSGNLPGDAKPRRTRLDGGHFDDEPLSCLLPELSSDISHAVHVEQRADEYQMILGPAEPPLAASLDIAMGVRYVAAMPARATEQEAFRNIGQLTRRAVDLMVIDLLLQRDVFGDIRPGLTLTLDTSGRANALVGPEPDGRETLRTESRLEPMGAGFERRGSPEADALVPAGQLTMQRLGWSPERFDRYRLEIVYPLPQVAHQLWFALPK